MDAWKKEYSNAVSYQSAMDWFWANADLEGYSLWKQTYKYNDELKVLFKVCNMCGTFIQYSDALRKWTFGCMWVIGDDSKNEYEVVGLWLTRTQEIKYMMEFNFEAEMYNWEKIDTKNVTDATKKQVFDLWYSEDAIDGKAVLDYKCFK